ncbi:MAG: hypothetical protein L0Y56_17245 [Nitrospira sp.]|nr:hypothetical protein [Nitrospira sp.]
MAELNVMGNFKNPWSSPIDEAKHISKWTWHPGTDTWQAVYGSNSIVTGSFGQFLGIIEKQKPESIHRINVFSHGSRGLIAFSGRIDPTTGMYS